MDLETAVLQFEGSVLHLIGCNPNIAFITKNTYTKFKNYNSLFLSKFVSQNCMLDCSSLPVKRRASNKFYIFVFLECGEYIILHELSLSKIKELTNLDDFGGAARLSGETNVYFYKPGEKLSAEIQDFNFIVIDDDSFARAELIDNCKNTKNAFGMFPK